MNKNIFLLLILSIAVNISYSQETIYPAPLQSETISLIHATIHVGNGQVIEDGMIAFDKGKIILVGKYQPPADNTRVIDCTGKQIYPGIILPDCNLGLNEISAVRSTRDQYELGNNNANIRAAIAYNSDSKIINTLRSNGVLLAGITPGGGIISGSSSVMQLDAWNWEDAVYKMDNGIHFNMPQIIPFSTTQTSADLLKDANKQLEEIRNFFLEAKAYFKETTHTHTNLKAEAVKGLFDQTQTFFIHAELVREMMMGIAFAKEFGFKTVIVGGSDSYKITDYLKQNNVAVILNATHNLPFMQDDDVDIYYKLPYLLQKAGVSYCINDNDDSNRGRNIMFNAGTAAAYGLTKEEALQAITLNTAKVLGIDALTGSLEKGKDANIIVSDGDILDIKTNNIINAFIQGRQINLDNKQKQLYLKYQYKYKIK